MNIYIAIAIGVILGGGFFTVYLKTGEKALNFSEPRKRTAFLAFFVPLRYVVLGGIAWTFGKLYPQDALYLLLGVLAGNMVFRLLHLRRELKHEHPR